MHRKVEVVAGKTGKLNAVFIAVVSVHVPKYIFGQHLYEQANACTGKWTLWHAGLEKQILHLQLLCLYMFPNIFLASTSMNKQVHTQESACCGVQDWKNKYYIYSCCVCSCSQIYFWAAPL